MKVYRAAYILMLVICALIISACSVNIGGPSPTATPANESERIIHNVERGVSGTRGLDAKADVPEHFITQPQLKENYTKLLAGAYSQEEADRDIVEWWLLGLVEDRTIDLYQMDIDLFANAVIGYYDPKQKELFVVTKEDETEFTPQAKIILAHEYVHSLQDQHFDFESHDAVLEDDADGQLAYNSVIEGDATLSSFKYAQSYMGSGEYLNAIYGGWQISDEEVANAPEYFSYVGYFPYEQGADFIREMLKDSDYDWSKVDNALKDPPKSTEQILHPDKYLRQPRDNPLPVALPPLTDTLGTGWTYTHSNTMGEIDFQALFDMNYVENYKEAAAGWGGSRYDLYQLGSNAFLIMGTRWDTPQDQTEFNEAMDYTLNWMDETDGVWTYDGLYYALTHTGDTSIYLATTNKPALLRVLETLK